MSAPKNNSAQKSNTMLRAISLASLLSQILKRPQWQTGFLVFMTSYVLLTKIGEGFLKTRILAVTIVLPLMVIGLLERNGLK